MQASNRKASSRTPTKRATSQRKVKALHAVRKPGTVETRFRFGPKWMKSIQEGKGIALAKANRDKLIATAEKFDVNISRLKDQSAIVAAISKRI